MKKIIGLLILPVFTACISPYKLPENGNVANVRFVSIMPFAINSSTSIKTFDCATQSAAHLGNLSKSLLIHFKGTDLEMSHKPSLTLSDYTEIRVVANQLLTGTVKGTYSRGVLRHSCEAPFSILPETEKEYELRFMYEDGHCKINHNEIQRDGLVVIPPQTLPQSCYLTNTGQFIKK